MGEFSKISQGESNRSDERLALGGMRLKTLFYREERVEVRIGHLELVSQGVGVFPLKGIKQGVTW